MNFSDDVLLKAERLIETKRINQDPDHEELWFVKSSRGDSTYRVQSDYDSKTNHLRYISCTCPHGLNSGGSARCYHVAAVLMLIRDARRAQLEGAPD